MKFPGSEELAAVMAQKDAQEAKFKQSLLYYLSCINYYLGCIAGKEDMAMELLKKENELEMNDLQS